MNREDIIRMAREAGLEKVVAWNKDFTQTVKVAPYVELERFAALVVAAEREACAVAAELVPAQWDYPVEIPHPAHACHDCAASIRARGQE